MRQYNTAIGRPSHKRIIDRWTQLTLLVNLMTYTTLYSMQFVKFFCGCESFFRMSKRAGESFATSASTKQKPVHCSGLIARKVSDKKADMDYHTVPPPGHQLEATPSVKSCVSKILNESTRPRQKHQAQATGSGWSTKLWATGC